MTSVVIAAHNEAAVIGRCLDALLADAAPGELDVTVVANGCTDDTAAVAASRPGVRVVDLAAPGKVGALNAGDEVAVGFPRIYLDADIVLSTAAVRALVAALADGAPAATVGRELVLDGRPLPVRAYFAVHGRLPVFRDGLFGRGVVALSEAGRARFGRFPDLVADDLFLDSLFTTDEKRQVPGFAARVETPRLTGDLVKRLVRVRGGNSAMRAAAESGAVTVAVRPANRLSWLRDVVLPRPWLAPAAVCYVAITLTAARSARAAGDGGATWGRDESSRQADPARE
jgi:glycosyltransferase involved in cell wall biosynthesis